MLAVALVLLAAGQAHAQEDPMANMPEWVKTLFDGTDVNVNHNLTTLPADINGVQGQFLTPGKVQDITIERPTGTMLGCASIDLDKLALQDLDTQPQVDQYLNTAMAQELFGLYANDPARASIFNTLRVYGNARAAALQDRCLAIEEQGSGQGHARKFAALKRCLGESATEAEYYKCLAQEETLEAAMKDVADVDKSNGESIETAASVAYSDDASVFDIFREQRILCYDHDPSQAGNTKGTCPGFALIPNNTPSGQSISMGTPNINEPQRGFPVLPVAALFDFAYTSSRAALQKMFEYADALRETDATGYDRMAESYPAGKGANNFSGGLIFPKEFYGYNWCLGTVFTEEFRLFTEYATSGDYGDDDYLKTVSERFSALESDKKTNFDDIMNESGNAILPQEELVAFIFKNNALEERDAQATVDMIETTMACVFNHHKHITPYGFGQLSAMLDSEAEAHLEAASMEIAAATVSTILDYMISELRNAKRNLAYGLRPRVKPAEGKEVIILPTPKWLLVALDTYMDDLEHQKAKLASVKGRSPIFDSAMAPIKERVSGQRGKTYFK